jgi:CelD/BcsL family acetyltransferase involved in cellulose biosynthesis
VAPTWAALFAACPDASFFLSVDWVEAWLETFGTAAGTRVLVFEKGGDTLGACLIAATTERQGPFPVRRLHLNTAGEPPGESVIVEFNALLCRPEAAPVVTATLAEYLAAERWNEFAVNGISEDALRVVEAAFPGLARDAHWNTDYYVDLARLRAAGQDYPSALSRNTREQLRRSLKLYDEVGPLRVDAAEDRAAAMAMLEELIALHQAVWVERGQRGAFTSPRIRAFHEGLIRRALPRGGVQLLRVSAGDEVIGVLYYFIERGRVHFYQSGLRYRSDNRYKPGFVTHALAIRYWTARGLDEYDFLAGNDAGARYKQSLSTGSRPLGWIIFQRPGVKLAAIALLRRLKRRVRRATSRIRSSSGSSD